MNELSVLPDDIQHHLEEKDRLIQALTDRLSDAAEQLDRHQRSGGNKGSRKGGPSGELLEQQRSLIEKLSGVLELWEDVQPRDAFARLEARLDDLREQMESAGDAPFMSRAAAAEAPESTTPHRAEAGETKRPQSSPTSGWEALKAQLLESAGSDAEPPRPRTASPADDSPPIAQQFAAEAAAQIEFPTPIDLQIAAREELEQAIEIRDRYICYLTGRLRLEEQRTRETIDWEALNNAPDALRKALQALERDLEERLRIAEVDLSLERARLSRVQSRTEELQRQIERRLQSRGGKTNTTDAAQKDRSDASSEKSPSKGWFSTLGLK
jgi:hypothetical protein